MDSLPEVHSGAGLKSFIMFCAACAAPQTEHLAALQSSVFANVTYLNSGSITAELPGADQNQKPASNVTNFTGISFKGQLRQFSTCFLWLSIGANMYVNGIKADVEFVAFVNMLREIFEHIPSLCM